MKKILTYRLNETEMNLLKGKVSTEYSKRPNFHDFSEIINEPLKNVFGVFIAFDESDNIDSLSAILKHFSDLPVFLVLRHKNFDALMLAFQGSISDTFENHLTNQNIDIAYVKMKIYFDELNKELPQAEIVDLFSSPLNIRSGNQLLFAINHYLINFKAVKNVALVEFSADGYHVRGVLNERVNFTQLMSIHLPIRFIGMNKALISGDVMTIGTPIYEKEGFYQWLVIDVEKEQKDYVLNDLFYRFLENILIYKKTKDKEESLLLLASTDDVTGLFNQRKLSEDLEMAISEHEAKHDTFSIMFIDLDHFKQVNDNYGHVVGSKLLSDLGKVLALILRQSDHIYRYGGDEFVIIMPNVDVGTVHEVALRVLERIKNYKFEIGNGEIYNMSISIGLAEYPTDAASAKEIIQFADDMMYESKKSGRGKVFHLREVGNVNAHIK